MGWNTRKQTSLVLSVLVVSYLTYQIIYCLSRLKTTVNPEIDLIRIAVALTGFFFSIVGGWIGFGFVGGILFAFYAFVIVFLVGGVSSTPIFAWFLAAYTLLCFFLYQTDQFFRDQIAGISVDREKYQNEKNDLEVSYKVKGEGISTLFEKYSTYYNLRKLAEELSTTLSVSTLSQTVVDRALDFIPRGDLARMAVAQTDAGNLSIIAFRKAGRREVKPAAVKNQTDLFDFWVIKNRRRLIVTDSHQDFRFDVKETTRQESIRSLIIAPLFHEARVMGTLRIHSAKPETFSNDDLRLLDTIAVLASSAISNAMLYEQTEELAIKDSLTGLYVRRYFFDRLKEEHRRVLMNKRPLSLLMCDLDHFKECNDRFGHGAGDLMLVQFAQILRQTFENAIVARYGGEEFSVLLPETEKGEAVRLAQGLRENVEKKPFFIRRERVSMTVSIGVAGLPEDTLGLESLVQKADQALYRAKREGRNRVCSSAA